MEQIICRALKMLRMMVRIVVVEREKEKECTYQGLRSSTGD